MTANPVLLVAGATSTAPDGTTLLDDVTFSVEPGWLVAVVGPTGAGKSSLAKAILGQLSLSAGTVRVAGRDHAPSCAGRVAGVPQEDATHPQLSLRRTLQHAAALRTDTTPAKRRQSVDTVLAELGLTGRAATRLSDLSGGERKRANVAVELVGRPDLLVLDEPTAGLDPGFEKSVFANLRALSDAGRTIVAITHSVRVLDVCDRVLFLAPGGVVAFFGTPAEAAAYFAWDDPADAYAALSNEPPASWKARLAAHHAEPVAGVGTLRPWHRPAGDRQEPDPGRPAWSRPDGHGAGEPVWEPATTHVGDRSDRGGHLRTLLHRALHVASSDRRALGCSLAAGPLLGLLLWAVLPGGTLGPPPADAAETGAPRAAVFAFFLAMTITWLAAAGAAREVVKERHILRREVGVGVSLPTYLTGKAVFLSALTAVQVLPLAGIAMVHQGAPSRGPALGWGIAEVMVVALLVGVVAVATGLLVSSWASTSEKAMTALPVILIAQMALAGPWAEGRGPVLEVLRHLVPARWAAAAVSATVLDDASAWWTAVAWLVGLVVVQLGSALALLRHSTPARAADGPHRLETVGTRLAAARPAGIRFLPLALGLLLAVAAGASALGRAGTASTVAATLALPAAPAAASAPAPLPEPDAAAAPTPAPPAPAPNPAPPPAPTRPPAKAPAAAPAGPSALPPATPSPSPAGATITPLSPPTTAAQAPQPPPPPPPASSPTMPPRPTATYSTAGGTVTVACSGLSIELISAVPANGYALRVIARGPGNVDVRFVRSGQELSVKSICFGQPIRYYDQNPPR